MLLYAIVTPKTGNLLMDPILDNTLLFRDKSKAFDFCETLENAEVRLATAEIIVHGYKCTPYATVQ